MVRAKHILFFIIFLTLVFQASAIECDTQIRVDTTLQEDLYCKEGALILNQSHTTIDCNGHTIYGKGMGNGIEILGTGSTIKNCKIDGFENGLLLTTLSKVTVQDSVIINNLIGAHLFETESITFTDNVIANNTFYGIYKKDSLNIDDENNQFSGNKQDTYELLTEIEPEEKTKPKEPVKEQQTKEAKDDDAKTSIEKEPQPTQTEPHLSFWKLLYLLLLEYPLLRVA